MKTVYLVRHAKSSWEHNNLRDHDRPLNNRGFNDANLMGNLAKNWKVKPQKIFSSSAKRALTTAQIFADYLGFAESDIAILENLYLCSVNEILNTIKSADDSLNSIALFSHNPTLTDFVNKFVEHYLDNVPTTGVACLQFDISSWKDATFKAQLALFDYPKKHK